MAQGENLGSGDRRRESKLLGRLCPRGSQADAPEILGVRSSHLPGNTLTERISAKGSKLFEKATCRPGPS
jgi:hypothetical protein